MADMLVKLYQLPNNNLSAAMAENKIQIRRAISAEKSMISNWIKRNFYAHWADEAEICFSRMPISLFIAIKHGEILGFACVEATFKSFFGPTAVKKQFRGQKIGEALLFEALNDLKNRGYAYAIIGGVGPIEFYEKSVGANLIEGSSESVYKDILV